MVNHYLKISFRNILKYKTQNIISILGLAVGFVCFAFSALWIRYEMSYDSFHLNAGRIYRVHIDDYKWNFSGTGNSNIREYNPYALTDWLKTNFPEIEEACGISSHTRDKYSFLFADSSFCKIFNVNIPEDFFIQGRMDRPVAVTDNHKGAIEYVKEQYNLNVLSTVPRWQANTNLHFDIIIPVMYSSEQLLCETDLYGRLAFRSDFPYCFCCYCTHNCVDGVASGEAQSGGNG